jgi:hypothetical protein
LLDRVALVGIQTAELVLHIKASLAAHVEQIFALHVQLARQGKDTNFLFLQAQLPVLTTRSGFLVPHVPKNRLCRPFLLF